MSAPERLPSTWEGREWPVLLAVARAHEEEGNALGFRDYLDVDLDEHERFSAIKALDDANFIRANAGRTAEPLDLLERGRRKVGLWPRSEDELVERFVAALEERIEALPEGPERTRLAKVLEELRQVGRATVAALVASAVKVAIGLE